jgi:hypothetical protein
LHANRARVSGSLTVKTGSRSSFEAPTVKAPWAYFEFHHAPIPGMRPHAHLGFMKAACVLEGEYGFRVGDAVFDGSPGPW